MLLVSRVEPEGEPDLSRSVAMEPHRQYPRGITAEVLSAIAPAIQTVSDGCDRAPQIERPHVLRAAALMIVEVNRQVADRGQGAKRGIVAQQMRLDQSIGFWNPIRLNQPAYLRQRVLAAWDDAVA